VLRLKGILVPTAATGPELPETLARWDDRWWTWFSGQPCSQNATGCVLSFFMVEVVEPVDDWKRQVPTGMVLRVMWSRADLTEPNVAHPD